MSDYNSSLPMRTQTDGDVVVKLGDGATPSNYASVDASGRLKSKIHDNDGHELSIESDGTINIRLKDEAGAAFSASNPLPVTLEESEGDEICSYQTASALASAAVVNHDYTVTTDKTLVLEQCWASGSGKIKVELKIETAAGAGTYNTKFVGFNSTSSPNVEIPIKKLLKQVEDAKVRITITNRDNQAQDVYSTLSGVEK